MKYYASGSGQSPLDSIIDRSKHRLKVYLLTYALVIICMVLVTNAVNG